jgi:hypothetical protein
MASGSLFADYFRIADDTPGMAGRERPLYV